MATETYQVRRTEFTRQEPWILQLLSDQPALLGFFVQFQSCFGRSAAPRDNEDFRGLYLSQPRIAELFESAGVKVDRKTVNRNLKQLEELGIISKAPVCDPGYVDSASKRIVWIYVINKTKPFEFDQLVRDLALAELEKSPYKNQAKNSAAKKAREAAGETKDERIILAEKKLREVCEQIALRFTDSKPMQRECVEFLMSGGFPKAAATAIKDLSSKKNIKVTASSFLQGSKSFGVTFTQEQDTLIEKCRDALNAARNELRMAHQEVRTAVNSPESPVEAPEYSIPTQTKSFAKSPEQVQAEEAERRADSLAERARLLEAEVDSVFADLLKELA